MEDILSSQSNRLRSEGAEQYPPNSDSLRRKVVRAFRKAGHILFRLVMVRGRLRYHYLALKSQDIASALGIAGGLRTEWDAIDLLMKDNRRIRSFAVRTKPDGKEVVMLEIMEECFEITETAPATGL